MLLKRLMFYLSLMSEQNAFLKVTEKQSTSVTKVGMTHTYQTFINTKFQGDKSGPIVQ